MSETAKVKAPMTADKQSQWWRFWSLKSGIAGGFVMVAVVMLMATIAGVVANYVWPL